MTLTVLGAVFLCVAGAQEAEYPLVLNMDQEIRSVIDARSQEEWRSALDELRTRAGEEHAVLIRQLFLFLRQSTTTKEAMAFGAIREALEIPDEHVIRALEPLLDGADTQLREALDGVLSEFRDEGPN